VKLGRVESIEERLALPVPELIPGQQAIPVATIGHHTYEGPGACRAELFGVVCGAHRDEHHYAGEDDQP
jgi:hypothetical protein